MSSNIATIAVGILEKNEYDTKAVATYATQCTDLVPSLLSAARFKLSQLADISPNRYSIAINHEPSSEKYNVPYANFSPQTRSSGWC